jgi:hypothetical protein
MFECLDGVSCLIDRRIARSSLKHLSYLTNVRIGCYVLGVNAYPILIAHFIALSYTRSSDNPDAWCKESIVMI